MALGRAQQIPVDLSGDRDRGAAGLPSISANYLAERLAMLEARDSVLSPLALGLVAGVAGHMVHQGVDLFRDRPLQQLLLLVAGLLAAMYRICAADRRRVPVSSTV